MRDEGLLPGRGCGKWAKGQNTRKSNRRCLATVWALRKNIRGITGACWFPVSNGQRKGTWWATAQEGHAGAWGIPSVIFRFPGRYLPDFFFPPWTTRFQPAALPGPRSFPAAPAHRMWEQYFRPSGAGPGDTGRRRGAPSRAYPNPAPAHEGFLSVWALPPSSLNTLTLEENVFSYHLIPQAATPSARSLLGLPQGFVGLQAPRRDNNDESAQISQMVNARLITSGGLHKARPRVLQELGVKSAVKFSFSYIHLELKEKASRV